MRVLFREMRFRVVYVFMCVDLGTSYERLSRLPTAAVARTAGESAREGSPESER